MGEVPDDDDGGGGWWCHGWGGVEAAGMVVLIGEGGGSGLGGYKLNGPAVEKARKPRGSH